MSKYLVEHLNSSLNKEDDMPLRRAAKNGHLAVVQEFEEFKRAIQSIA